MTDQIFLVYDCLYAGLLPNEQSNFASAQVVLGLTPGLLATVAPSLGEVSMLSSQRPFLSLLLSLGGPAVFVPRLLGYTDPLETLQPVPSFFGNRLRRFSSLTANTISLIEYILVAGAISNVIYVSWQLGWRTVVAWKCNSSYLPFLWSSLPVVIHLFAATAWHWSESMRQVEREEEQHQVRTHVSIPLIGTVVWLPRWLQREFTLSANCPRRNYRARPGNLPEDKRDARPLNSGLPVFLMEAAELMAFVHILFGTVVFSSLTFIATLDAVGVIVRYILSGCVCRFVLMYELQNMRLVENAETSEVEYIQKGQVELTAPLVPRD